MLRRRLTSLQKRVVSVHLQRGRQDARPVPSGRVELQFVLRGGGRGRRGALAACRDRR